MTIKIFIMLQNISFFLNNVILSIFLFIKGSLKNVTLKTRGMMLKIQLRIIGINDILLYIQIEI